MFFDRVLVLAMASPVLLSRGDEVIVMDVIFNHLFTPFFGLITWLWLSQKKFWIRVIQSLFTPKIRQTQKDRCINHRIYSPIRRCELFFCRKEVYLQGQDKTHEYSYEVHRLFWACEE
jgi:hypothetical protein